MAQPKGTAKANTSILDLDSLEPRKGHIRLDGKPYPLVNIDALGLRHRQRLARMLQRVFEIAAIDPDKMTDADEAEYEEKLRELVPLIVPGLTAPVMKKLNVGHLSDIAASFFVWAGARTPQRTAHRAALLGQMQEIVSQLPKSTGANGSRASSGSTEATPNDG